MKFLKKKYKIEFLTAPDMIVDYDIKGMHVEYKFFGYTYGGEKILERFILVFNCEDNNSYEYEIPDTDKNFKLINKIFFDNKLKRNEDGTFKRREGDHIKFAFSNRNDLHLTSGIDSSPYIEISEV